MCEASGEWHACRCAASAASGRACRQASKCMLRSRTQHTPAFAGLALHPMHLQPCLFSPLPAGMVSRQAVWHAGHAGLPRAVVFPSGLLGQELRAHCITQWSMQFRADSTLALG